MLAQEFAQRLGFFSKTVGDLNHRFSGVEHFVRGHVAGTDKLLAHPGDLFGQRQWRLRRLLPWRLDSLFASVTRCLVDQALLDITFYFIQISWTVCHDDIPKSLYAASLFIMDAGPGSGDETIC